MQKKIMAIGAHADDIELRAGGTLLKYLKKGYEIIYIMSTNNFSGCWSKRQTDGSIKVEKPIPEIIMKQRKLETEKAAAVFGTSPVHLDHPQRHYNLPDGSQAELRYGSPPAPMVKSNVSSILTAPENPDNIEKLSEFIKKHSPECIVTHGPIQVNPEHSATSLLVTRAWKKAKEDGISCGLLYWGEEHVIFGQVSCKWDSFINISDYLEEKINAIAIHETQMPRALEANFPHRVWNKIRGQACGCYASETFTINHLEEGFELSREISGNRGEYFLNEYPSWDNNGNIKMVKFN